MIIAIIGEAGVGKTTATNFFQSKGAYIISADLIVNYIYRLPETKEKIAREFGDKFLNHHNNTVDLLALRKYAFENYEFLKKLEKLIWPEMSKVIVKEINSHKNESLVILDCAVLFNAKLDYLVDKVLLIEADEELKINRIKNRDNVQDDEAINLLNLQKKHLILDKKNDFVVKNNSSIENFIKNLKYLLPKLIN